MLIKNEYQDCLDACLACMEACNFCFNACLNENDVKMMATCIRLDRECGDVCSLAATAIQSDSPFKEEICKLCAEICAACGEECSKHTHEHCQMCADACFRCAEACRRMITA